MKFTLMVPVLLLSVSVEAVATDSESEQEDKGHVLKSMEEGRLSSNHKLMITESDGERATKMLNKLEQGEECPDDEPLTGKKTDIKRLLLKYTLALGGQELSKDAKRILGEKLKTWLNEEGAQEVEGLAFILDQNKPIMRRKKGTSDTEHMYEVQKKLLKLLIESTNESTEVAKRALAEQKKQRKLAEGAAVTSQLALAEQKEQKETVQKQLKLQRRMSIGGALGTAAGLIATVALAVLGF